MEGHPLIFVFPSSSFSLKQLQNATKDPPSFGIDSATSKWFTQYVRHDIIVELGKLMRSATDPLPINVWPDARSIIYDTGGKPESVLREFLKKFQDRASFICHLPYVCN